MFLIRTGIPSLDGMFRPGNPDPGDNTWEQDQLGIFLRGASRTTSICIAGPDGTGKSVLAMHFASRYLADCHEYCRSFGVNDPLAFYVSSDLSHPKAEAMWTNFRLGIPNTRRIPFRYPQLSDEVPFPKWLGSGPYDADYRLGLESYVPHRAGMHGGNELKRLDDLADYLHQPARRPQIAFFDLASHTAGDDWGFIERLLAAMPEPETHTPEMPRHLLLIDAMEGMETFAGDVDAFGQKTTRRGRVAKLMRLASAKCHLILVIEEPQESVRMAEQFVADVVLRLRATESQGYTRRTVEIEKARGQAHVRGRHPYVVRDGRGSTTGEQVNFDDPRVEESGTSQSYLDVFSSLHSVSRSIMENRAPGRDHPSHRRAGFGIEELDEMLAKAQAPADADDQADAHGQDPSGLPCGAVSALIGDANTQKTFLGHAFLGHVFHKLAWDLATDNAPPQDNGWPDLLTGDHESARAHYVSYLCTTTGPGSRCPPVRPQELPAGVLRWAQRIEEKGRGVAGAVVLVTTKDENNRTLAERFCNQLREATVRKAGRELPIWKDPDFLRAFAAYLESRTICRRLEIHDTPSAVLFHVIRRSIEAAQQIVTHEFPDVCIGRALDPDAAVRARKGWRIRFALDDFNSVMRTYGRVHDDPLFLPFLLVYLRREGLSSLIIETQSGTHGMPAMLIGDDAQSDLRALSDYRLYTWHITDFFGDHRIAIAAIPPMVQQDRKSPVIVRELEWYEPSSRSSTPKVNPRFELYAGLDTNRPTLVPLRVHLYAETAGWKSYITGLDELWKRVFEPPQLGREHRTVVAGEKADHYELMHEVCGLLANTNLDYSLVIQIDEFWQHHDAFRLQTEYMMRAVDDVPDGSVGNPLVETRVARFEWFDHDIGYGSGSAEELKSIDRIPFFWDFGFLACKEDLWEESIQQGAREGKKRDEISRVWGLLTADQPCTWHEVLRAASYVAEWESARRSRPVPAFDLAMVAPQTFSCLLLEMWFSEIYDTHPAMAEQLAWLMERRRWNLTAEKMAFSSLILDYSLELYRVWLLLAQSLDLGAFAPRSEGFGFAFGRRTDPNAIVTRHWYKSAALIESGADKGGNVRFCRLPGHFSARGDWFLTTVRGSRSDRLADRALDLLSTREANVDRLMRGLGLPTRRLNAESRYLSSRLKGSFGSGNRNSTLTYADVLSMGVIPGRKNFHWLWRGNLEDYDASARIWERWLYRTLRLWKRTREHYASDWVDGFELYEMVRDGKAADIPPHVVSYSNIPIQRDRLLGELQQLKRERPLDPGGGEGAGRAGGI